MSALAYHSPRQIVACLVTRAHHAEPRLQAKHKPDREAAAARVKVVEDELKRCLHGPGFLIGVEI